jgi:hypothetical protein
MMGRPYSIYIRERAVAWLRRAECHESSGCAFWQRHQHGDRLGLAVPENVELVPAEKLGFKKPLSPANAIGPTFTRKRAQWKKYQGRITPERLVFIDETWTKTNMAPLPEWAPRGTRLTNKVPHGRWKMTTFLADLRNSGMTPLGFSMD